MCNEERDAGVSCCWLLVVGCWLLSGSSGWRLVLFVCLGFWNLICFFLCFLLLLLLLFLFLFLGLFFFSSLLFLLFWNTHTHSQQAPRIHWNCWKESNVNKESNPRRKRKAWKRDRSHIEGAYRACQITSKNTYNTTQTHKRRMSLSRRGLIHFFLFNFTIILVHYFYYDVHIY